MVEGLWLVKHESDINPIRQPRLLSEILNASTAVNLDYTEWAVQGMNRQRSQRPTLHVMLQQISYVNISQRITVAEEAASPDMLARMKNAFGHAHVSRVDARDFPLGMFALLQELFDSFGFITHADYEARYSGS